MCIIAISGFTGTRKGMHEYELDVGRVKQAGSNIAWFSHYASNVSAKMLAIARAMVITLNPTFVCGQFTHSSAEGVIRPTRLLNQTSFLAVVRPARFRWPVPLCFYFDIAACFSEQLPIMA